MKPMYRSSQKSAWTSDLPSTASNFSPIPSPPNSAWEGPAPLNTSSLSTSRSQLPSSANDTQYFPQTHSYQPSRLAGPSTPNATFRVGYSVFRSSQPPLESRPQSSSRPPYLPVSKKTRRVSFAKHDVIIPPPQYNTPSPPSRPLAFGIKPNSDMKNCFRTHSNAPSPPPSPTIPSAIEAFPARHPATVPTMPSLNYPSPSLSESLPQTSGDDEEEPQENQGGSIELSTNDGWNLSTNDGWNSEFSHSKHYEMPLSSLFDHAEQLYLDAQEDSEWHPSVNSTLGTHIPTQEMQLQYLDSQEEWPPLVNPHRNPTLAVVQPKALAPSTFEPPSWMADTHIPTAGYNTSASPNNSNYVVDNSIGFRPTPKPAGIFMSMTTSAMETLSRSVSGKKAERSTNDYRDSVNREPFDKASRFCLDGLVCEKSKFVVACGGFSDVWKGKLKVQMKDSWNGSAIRNDTYWTVQLEQDVAIKTLRGFNPAGKSFAQAKMLRRLWREYLAWSSLSHPNIIECLGFTYDFVHESQYQVPALISPWMSNGTVFSYILEHPEKDRMGLIVGITQGLCYLHSRSPPIVHGDIRAANILVSDEGIPRFTDFGLSRILQDGMGLTTSTDTAGSLRWMAPELFYNYTITEASDVWAYGMTILEILTSKKPYAQISLDAAVLQRITDGYIPPKPSPQEAPSMTWQLWNDCVQCWTFDANERLPVSEIAFQLINEYEFGKAVAVEGVRFD